MFRALFVLLVFYSSLATAAQPPLVAAASNMTRALSEIAGRFEKQSGIKVKLSFGSSGNFARQILQGAPYQIFLAADKKYVDKLTAGGHKVLRNEKFARGSIGFFIPKGSVLSGKTSLEGVVNAIEFDEYKRMVYANPEYAPYGAAAQQALQSAGVWDIDKSKLLLGENAAQAMQFTLAGGVDVGIIPASYAVLPNVKDKGRFIPIPEQWHKPIQQYLALLSDSNPAGVRFYNYLLSADPLTVLTKYGYTGNPQVNVSARQ